MEKSVDWFAENSWPARNNYLEEKTESHACSKDEDTPDCFAENSWPKNTKYFDGKEEEADSHEGQGTEKDSEDKDTPPPDWFDEHSWPASKKCEKESSASEESWLRETGWPVRHEMSDEVVTQQLGDFDYKLKLHQQWELEEDQKGRTQQSCCWIL